MSAFEAQLKSSGDREFSTTPFIARYRKEATGEAAAAFGPEQESLAQDTVDHEGTSIYADFEGGVSG